MSGLLGGWLSPALTALTQTVGGYEQGKVLMDKQQRQEALLARQAERTQKNDEVMNVLRAAQTGEAEARARAVRSAKPKRTPQTFTLNGAPTLGSVDESGAYYDTAGQPVTAGVTPYQKPDTNIDPYSQEGIAAALARARAMAGIQAGTHETNRNFDVAHPMPQQATTKPTEFSNKAALVYQRAKDAAASLDQFYTTGIPTKQGLGAIPVVGNFMLSPAEQRAQSAAETVSSAILRLESGAAISEHEVKEYAKQFLPQIGDKPEVLAEKRERLQTQLERMRQAATPTMQRDQPAPATPTAPAAPVQTIDAMIRAGKSDAEIKAVIARGVQ